MIPFSFVLASWLWPATPKPDPDNTPGETTILIPESENSTASEYTVPEPTIPPQPSPDAIFFCEEWLTPDTTRLSCSKEREHVPSSDAEAVDLTPLTALKSLQYLNFSSGYLEFIDTMVVSDVSPLASLTRLQSLTLSHTTLQDASPLGQMTTLTELDLHASRMTDISPLASLTALESLDLSCTPVEELGPLIALPALRELNITQAAVTDLSPLLEMPMLEKLGISKERLDEPAIQQLQQQRPSLQIYEGARY